MPSGDHVLHLPGEATLIQNISTLAVRLQEQAQRRVCSLLSSTQSTLSIPYSNIISTRLNDNEVLHITYVESSSSQKGQLRTLRFNAGRCPDRGTIQPWIEALDSEAWTETNTQRQKRVKVLINPAGGLGNARKVWHRDIKPVLEAAHYSIDVEITTHKGHAVDIARNINIMDFDVIACCSGDGLPHEVFNGLGQRQDARLALVKIAVVQLPCGSGNAMCWNSFGTADPTLATMRFVKSKRMPLDLLSLTQHDPETNQVKRTLSFLSQAVGIVAECDLGTENLRWVGGKRFELGFLIRVMRKTIYPCDIAIATECDTKEAVRQHYAAEIAKNDVLEPRRLDAALKEYQMRDEDREHAAYAGLPQLRYGTVSDALPAGWTETAFDNLGNFYCGNMTIMSADAPFFPAALPTDGLCDLVTVRGDISRLLALDMAGKVPNYQFFDIPEVNYRKITAYRITPKAKSGYISVDGESVHHTAFQAEVHRALGTTMSTTGRRYEAREFA